MTILKAVNRTCVVCALVMVGVMVMGRGVGLTGAQPSTLGGQAFVGTTVYVSTNGSDRNSGTQSSPVATIQQAVSLANRENRARRDALVLIAPGIYRESVNVGAQKTTNALILEGAGSKPEDVVITGADDWSTGWTRQDDGSYVHEWPYSWA